eukprot:3629147-Rhodomonas_salina.2
MRRAGTRIQAGTEEAKRVGMWRATLCDEAAIGGVDVEGHVVEFGTRGAWDASLLLPAFARCGDGKRRSRITLSILFMSVSLALLDLPAAGSILRSSRRFNSCDQQQHQHLLWFFRLFVVMVVVLYMMMVVVRMMMIDVKITPRRMLTSMSTLHARRRHNTRPSA